MMKYTMNRNIIRCMVTAVMWLSLVYIMTSSLCIAQNEEENVSAVEVKKKKQEASPVVKSLKKLKKVNGRLNSKADYFIYLISGAGCSKCHDVMPEIVEHHKEMRKDGRVDIILMFMAATPGVTKAFAKDYKVKFYTVMENDKNMRYVPGYVKPSGIPRCIVVDRYSKVISQGATNIISNWQETTINKGIPEPPEKR